MAESTAETFSRDQVNEAALQSSDQESIFRNRINQRVQLVADSLEGKRRFRNLWGLRPVRQQELYHFTDGDGLFPSVTWVAGRQFHFGAHLGEDLVESSAYQLGQSIKGNHDEIGRNRLTIIDSWTSQLANGLIFKRTAYSENRTLPDGSQEFVPGFPPTFEVFWYVSLPESRT